MEWTVDGKGKVGREDRKVGCSCVKEKTNVNDILTKIYE